MPLHSRITSVPDGSPSSRFGRPLVFQIGTVDYNIMNWTAIAQLEADKVADWIIVMRRHKRRELYLVLHGVSEVLEAAESMATTLATSPYHPWTVYARTGVPGLLVDLASDLDMYTPTGGGLVYHVSTHSRV